MQYSKLLAALLCLWPSLAWAQLPLTGAGGSGVAANYYTDATSGGSDSNDCLTTSTACLTLAHLNTLNLPAHAVVHCLGSFGSGDALAFTTSNSAGYVTVTDYGAGCTINSGNSTAGITATNLPDVHIIKATALNIVGGGNTTNTTAGISIINSQAGNTKLVGPTISGVTVSAYGGNCIEVKGTNGTSGFSTTFIGTATVVHDCTGNTVTSTVGSACIYFYSTTGYGTGTTTPSHTAVSFNGITAYNCTGKTGGTNWSGSGIVVADTSGVDGKNLLVHDFGVNSDGGQPCGVWAYDATLVHYYQMEVYNGLGTGANGGCGVDLDGGVTNSLAERFWSHDNNGEGAQLYAYNDGTLNAASNNTLRDFIVQNNMRNGTAGDGEILIGAASGATLTNPQAYNFTCYAGVGGICLGAIATGTIAGTNALVANHVLLGVAGDNLVSVVHPGTLKLEGGDYNGSTDFSWGGSNYTTYASFVSGAGVETVNGGHTFNPQIYVPGGGFITAGYAPSQMMAYNPQAGAAVIGAGINLQTQFGINPGTQDFFGNAVTAATLPIGAGAADFATFTASCTQASTFLALTTGFNKLDDVNYNSWICGENSDGDLALMDVAYLLAAPNHAAMLLDVSGNGHNLTEHGTVTFTARTGIASDGTSGYEDTGWNVNSGPNYTQNSVTTGGYDLTTPGAVSGSACLIGVSNTGQTAETTIIPRASSSSAYIDANDETGTSTATSSAAGFWMGHRTASNALSIYKNGSTAGPAAVNSVALPNQNMFVLAESGGAGNTPLASSYFTDTVSLAFVGGGGISPLNTSLRANSFMKAYGINVY